MNRVVIIFRFSFGVDFEKVCVPGLLLLMFSLVRIYFSSQRISSSILAADNYGYHRLFWSDLAFAVLMAATYCVLGSFELVSIICLTICNAFKAVVGCLTPSPGYDKNISSGLAVL